LTDESRGFAFFKSGGSESLNPPWGGTILAQPDVRTTIFRLEKIMKINTISLFIMGLFN
jgi:hypothetical protein